MLTFIIAGGDPAATEDLRAALSKDARVRLISSGSDVRKLYADIVRLRPAACVVSLDEASASSSQDAIRRVAAEFPETVIICASRDTAPDVILGSLRAGGREFLRLPIDAGELRTVLDRTAEFCVAHSKAAATRGRSVAVFSGKGGVGTSLIAANLAASLGAPTALLDLNLQSGDLDLFFGVKPKFSIADVVENRSRLDDSLLANYLVNCSPNVTLLAAPPEASLAEGIEPEHVSEVMELLQRQYDYVVIDLPHAFDAITLDALDQADDILLILTLDVSSIRNAQRALAIFDRLGYTRNKVRVVVNRWSKQADLEIAQVERFLGERVTAFVHNDYRAAVNSINLGQPLVVSEPSSAVSVDIKRLADTITGTSGGPAGGARRRIFGSIFRRPSPSAEPDLRTGLSRGVNDLRRAEG